MSLANAAPAWVRHFRFQAHCTRPRNNATSAQQDLNQSSLLDVRYHGGIQQCGGVSQVFQFAFGNFAQYAAHDLAGAGLGQTFHKLNDVWLGYGTNNSRYGLVDVLPRQFFIFVHPVEDYVGVNALAFDGVRVTHYRTFHHPCVAVDGVFHFGRTDAVPGNIEDVVHPAGNAVPAFFVPQAAVAGEIEVVVGGEIGLPAPFVVAVGGAQDSGPRGFDAEVAADVVSLQLNTVFVHQYRLNTRERIGRKGGFGWGHPGQIADEYPSGLCLPPGIHNGALVGSDSVVVPMPGLLVDGFADGAQYF